MLGWLRRGQIELSTGYRLDSAMGRSDILLIFKEPIMPTSISKHRLAAFNRQNGRCFYCGLPMWLKQPAAFAAKYKISEGDASRFRCTAEHLKARQDGGTNSGNNIVAACRHCNMTRHRISPPPSPMTYKKRVRRIVRAGKWHHRSARHLGTMPLERGRKAVT